MSKFSTVLSAISVAIIITILMFLAGGIYGKTQMTNNVYPKTGRVVYVDHDTDLVLIEDYIGMRWLYKGAEDWMAGDICSMIMDKNGTEEIKDDEIINIKYEGWIDGN